MAGILQKKVNRMLRNKKKNDVTAAVINIDAIQTTFDS
jgi:hypothetical protein